MVLPEHSIVAPRSEARLLGLDMYSMFRSADAVIEFLDKVDPEAANRARACYGCFDNIGRDEQAYGYSMKLGLAPSCEDSVVQIMTELHERASEYERRLGVVEDESLYARINATLVHSAEKYYRTMFRSGHRRYVVARDCTPYAN